MACWMKGLQQGPVYNENLAKLLVWVQAQRCEARNEHNRSPLMVIDSLLLTGIFILNLMLLIEMESAAEQKYQTFIKEKTFISLLLY